MFQSETTGSFCRNSLEQGLELSFYSNGYDTVIFTVGCEKFTLRDAVFYAAWTGGWDEFIEEFAEKRSLQLEYHRTSSGQRHPLIQDLLREFRYGQSLITKNEFTLWLQKFDLEAEDLIDHLERKALFAESDGRGARLIELSAEDAAGFWNEGVLSGAFTRFSHRLAEIACHWDEKTQSEAENFVGARLDTERFRRFTELCRVETEDPAQFLAELRMQAILRNRCEHYCLKRVTRKAISDLVEEQGLDWTWIDYTMATFAGESQAREAMLALSHDGRALLEVAREASASVSRLAHLAGEDDETRLLELPAKILNSTEGDAVGPFETDAGFAILQVRKKVPPDPSNPEIYGRAVRLMREELLRKLIAERVEWAI